MKILKDLHEGNYDFAVCGLGFESRAISAYNRLKSRITNTYVLGYDENTDQFSYISNKDQFVQSSTKLFEISDSQLGETIQQILNLECSSHDPVHVLLDITVMSRHRLATLISTFIDELPKGSSLTIIYSLSKFIPPPEGTTPVKKVCEIADGFEGSLGDLSLPTTSIIGLGYEKGKALGISNYLDSWRDFVLVPQSSVVEFEKAVKENNSDFLESLPSERIINYDVLQPYNTYLDLKSLVLNLNDQSRPLLIPLGPKILSALCVIIAKELSPSLPVWRVSSEYSEAPVDRPASGHEISFTLQL